VVRGLTHRCGYRITCQRGVHVPPRRRRTTCRIPVSISRSHRIKDCGAPTTIRRRCECLESSPATSPGQWAAPWGSGVPSWSHRTRGTRAFRRLDPGSRLRRAAGTRRHHSAVDGGVLDGRAGGSAGAVRGDLCCRNIRQHYGAWKSAVVGMGLHPFRDPAVREDFHAVRLPIDVAQFHSYAVD
jgi:hypothetical protein